MIYLLFYKNEYDYKENKFNLIFYFPSFKFLLNLIYLDISSKSDSIHLL